MSHPGTPDLADAGFGPMASAPVSRLTARALAATLDLDPSTALHRGELPLPWHWTIFTPFVATGGLGDDGHPRRRAALAGFPSRMWAGGRVRGVSPLRLDVEAQRSSAVVHAEEKRGSGGALRLVTVQHTITQDGTVCVEEEQDLVFRGAGPTPASGPEQEAPPELGPGAWCEEFRASPVLLFRYSALTFNSHRIHYDRAYAVGVEGYEDLVVHGPLTATMLTEFARRRAGRAVVAIDFRARAPLFAGRRVWLTGVADGDGADLAAIRHDHTVAMTVRVEFAAP